jgi:transglutaminase-like putative cysteine protease
MIRLSYSVDLAYQIYDSTADFIFNFEVARTHRQTIVAERFTITPDIVVERYTDDKLANRVMRVRAPNGPLSIHYEATVDIDHRLGQPDALTEVPIAQLPFDVLPYLAPSRYCQSDRLLEFALREFGNWQFGYRRVEGIRNWVNQHVRFMSRSTNASTSALDTVVERTGVCRDFAHLMIAICRALSIPARFVSTLDYGADPSLGPPDFHAVVEVYLSGGWYLFDPSGTSIPTGLPRIGIGRDASDIPFAAIFGNVASQAPVIRIVPIEDAAQGLRMPEATPLAISTS